MDLADLSVVVPPVAMPLLHPTTRQPLMNEKKPVEILVVSRDHPDFRNFMRTKRDMMAAAVVRENPNALKQEWEYADNLSAVVKGVENLVVDKKPFVFTREAFRDLLLDPRFPWIGSQVDAYVSDLGNFIKASP